MFQLIYMRFTQPRADRGGVRRADQPVEDADGEPEPTRPRYAFNEALDARSWGRTIRAGGCRRRPRSTSGTSTSRWRSTRTASPTRATSRSSFVGNIDLPAMKPLVERYLGSLPSLRRKETWKDVEARRRRPASSTKTRREGHRAEEPVGDRLHRAVRLLGGAAHRAQRDGAHSPGPAARSRSARISAAPTASAPARAPGGSRSAPTRSRSPSAADPKRLDDLARPRLPGDRAVQDERSDGEAGRRRARSAAARLRDRARSRTGSCSAS